MRPQSKCSDVVIRKGEMIWTGFITTNLGDFDPAYVLLVTGCDCLFFWFKLFSFLIRLPLYINQTCKYSTFQSYVWIVLYQLRLATEKKEQKRGKKYRKNLRTPPKRAMLYRICIHF